MVGLTIAMNSAVRHHVRAHPGTVPQAAVLSLIGLILAVIVVTLAVCIILVGDHAPHPLTIGYAAGGAVLVIAGPLLMRYLSRAAGDRLATCGGAMGRLQIHPRRTRAVRLGAVQATVHPRVGRLRRDSQELRGQAPAHLGQSQRSRPAGIRAARGGPAANHGPVTTEWPPQVDHHGQPRGRRALSRRTSTVTWS